MREATSIKTRRTLLRALGTALPIGAGLTFAGKAFGFSREEMPAPITTLYRGRCEADAVHAPTLEAAFARLDAAGITYDRVEVAATSRCPICGCRIIAGREPPDVMDPRPPSF